MKDDKRDFRPIIHQYSWLQVLVMAVIYALAIIGAIAILIAPAFAQETYSFRSYTGREPTFVEVGPPQVPLAVATVTFHNSNSDNNQSRTHDFTMTHGELTLSLRAVLGTVKPDTLEVSDLTPGYIAVPCCITIPDGSSYVIHIYPEYILPGM